MKKISALMVMLFLGASCTPNSTPPDFSNTDEGLPIEACKKVQFDLKKLDAVKIRSITTCLNGKNDALKEYKVFLDNMDTGELNTLLEVYNKHIFPNNRLSKILDVVDRIKKNGQLPSLMKDLQVMTESGVLQNLVPIASRLLKPEITVQDNKKAIKAFSKFIIQAIEQNLLSPVTVSAANSIGGLRARALAILLSSNNPNSILNSDKVIDIVAENMLASFKDHTFHRAATFLSDPALIRSFRLNSDAVIEDFSDLFTFIPQGSYRGANKLIRLSQMIQGGDQKMKCFKDQKGFTREIDNLLSFMARESSQYTDRAAGDRFFLQAVPVLMAAVDESCEYERPQDKKLVTDNLEVLYDTVAKGYGDGVRGLFRVMITGNRFDTIANAFKSDYLTRMGPILEELGLRGGMNFLLQIASKDISDLDVFYTSTLLNLFVSKNLEGVDLENWIKSSVKNPDSQKQLLQIVSRLKPQFRNLVHLAMVVSQDPTKDQALKDLKAAQADTTFDLSPSEAFMILAQNVAAPEFRKELHKFGRSAVTAMADSRGGLGDMLSVSASAVSFSTDNPLQDTIKDVLADEDLVDRFLPIFYKISMDPHFQETLNLTGKLAANGNLEKLIMFLVDLFRISGGSGLDPNKPPFDYTKPITDPQDLIDGSKPYTPKPPIGNFTTCGDIKGSLFDKNGDNLFLALRCLNAAKDFDDLERLARHLKDGQVLDDVSEILRNIVTTSPYLDSSLTQLQRLLKSGQLASVLKLLIYSADPHELPYRLDPILKKMLDPKNVPNIDQSLRLVGEILSYEKLGPALKTFADLSTLPGKKLFKSQNNFAIQINNADAIRAQIKKDFPNYNAKQAEEAFQVAAKNFATHNDWWLYDGPYEPQTTLEKRETIITMLKDLTRGDDLLELVRALQDISLRYDMPAVLGQLIDDHRTTPHINFRTGEVAPRIMSALDQLETLVMNADMTISIPVVYKTHVGTTFQVGLAKSNDLKKTLEDQKGLIQNLAKTYVCGTGQDGKCFRVKNILANYSLLEQLRKDGNLGIFKRLYEGLYKATPKNDRDKEDPKVNHMAVLNYFNQMGIFHYLAMGLSSVKRQSPDFFRPLVGSVFDVVRLLDDSDILLLKNILVTAMTPYGSDGVRPIDILLDHFMSLQTDTEAFENFKDTLIHLSPSLYALGSKPTGVLASLPMILQDRELWSDIVDSVFEEGQKPTSSLLDLAANVLVLDPKKTLELKDMLVPALSPLADGSVLLPSVVKTFFYGRKEARDDWERLSERFKNFGDDPRVTAMNVSGLIRNILKDSEDLRGMNPIFGELLKDPNKRTQLINILYVLSDNQDIKPLMQILVQQAKTGNIERAVKFVIDNVKAAPVH